MLDFPIDGSGPLSSYVRALGFTNFAQVSEFVRALPYARVPVADDTLAVFRYGWGTCSSKHRFLAALAHECRHIEVTLMLGLYEMSDRNTPGVGRVLAAAQVDAIPEAHCYLMCGGRRYDFTGIASGTSSPIDSLVEEHAVAVDNLSAVKEHYHRDALARWAHSRDMNAQQAWDLREPCIAELAVTRRRS